MIRRLLCSLKVLTRPSKRGFGTNGDAQNVDLDARNPTLCSVSRETLICEITFFFNTGNEGGGEKETKGTEKKEEENDSLENGQTASLATPNAHPCSQE